MPFHRKISAKPSKRFPGSSLKSPLNTAAKTFRTEVHHQATYTSCQRNFVPEWPYSFFVLTICLKHLYCSNLKTILCQQSSAGNLPALPFVRSCFHLPLTREEVKDLKYFSTTNWCYSNLTMK